MRRGHPGTAPATVSASGRRIRHCAQAWEGATAEASMPRARVRRPAAKSTGCDAEGVAAAMPALDPAARPFSSRLPKPCAYAGVRAMENCMHRHLPAAVAAFAFLSSLALPGNARADAAAADLDTV